MAFDLSRALKPPPSIWDIFPWGELAFEIVLVAGMAGWFGTRVMALQDAYTKIRTESGQHECLASRDTTKLDADKKDLKGKIDAVRRFLESRSLWSAYTPTSRPACRARDCCRSAMDRATWTPAGVRATGRS